MNDKSSIGTSGSGMKFNISDFTKDLPKQKIFFIDPKAELDFTSGLIKSSELEEMIKRRSRLYRVVHGDNNG